MSKVDIIFDKAPAPTGGWFLRHEEAGTVKFIPLPNTVTLIQARDKAKKMGFQIGDFHAVYHS